ncbi:hypothetical protein [Pedobacter cryoconitis]|uniref:Uncharacterized protein n=1 Tax=Pedobacter cryoconitis TaxID=188932 RepID=A0A7X0J386_9SPHI|nr:hypothetical protein [Pedobacter cryoconitis]MBB6498972.1 hypothetical protein [Pedobacter cryoconitis]
MTKKGFPLLDWNIIIKFFKQILITKIMKTSKKAWLSAIASLVLLIAISFTFAFKSADTSKAITGKKVLQYFYRYTSSSTSQADIQNIANYQRSNLSCDGANHVCGVYLATDKPQGQQPVATQFNAVKSDLWLSEQAATPTLSSISMRD